jgi:hypothetical protein
MNTNIEKGGISMINLETSFSEENKQDLKKKVTEARIGLTGDLIKQRGSGSCFLEERLRQAKEEIKNL